MAQQFVNNFSSTLAAGLASGALSMTLQPGDGALLEADGTLSPTDFMLLTLQNDSGQIEIVQATGVAGDVVTIVRNQESTGDYNWAIGATVECRLTAGTLESFGSGGGAGVEGPLYGSFFEVPNSAGSTTLIDFVTNGDLQYVYLTAANGSGTQVIDPSAGLPTLAPGDIWTGSILVFLDPAVTFTSFYCNGPNADGPPDTWDYSSFDNHGGAWTGSPDSNPPQIDDITSSQVLAVEFEIIGISPITGHAGDVWMCMGKILDVGGSFAPPPP